MGTLYWQINDCWPVASWSSIDYYGRWKALHYYARDAFSDVLVSPYTKDDMVYFKVVSDKSNAIKAELNIRTMTLYGETVYTKHIPFNLEANGCSDIVSVDRNELLGEKEQNEVFTYVELIHNGKVISDNIYYPVYSNEYNYPKVSPSIKIEDSDNEIKLRVKSSELVRGLYLFVDDEETFFERNFLTLIPGKEEVISLKTNLKKNEIEKRIKYFSVNSVN